MQTRRTLESLVQILSRIWTNVYVHLLLLLFILTENLFLPGGNGTGLNFTHPTGYVDSEIGQELNIPGKFPQFLTKPRNFALGKKIAINLHLRDV